MKNININHIEPANNVDYGSNVRLFIAEGDQKAPKTMESLGRPNDINEARERVSQIIKANSKYFNYVDFNDKGILDKILYDAFSRNLEINQALDTFLRHKTPFIASARVEVVMNLGKIANNPTYEPVSESLDLAA